MSLPRILGLAFFIGLTVFAFTPGVMGTPTDRSIARIATLDD